jgi:hypothetical protein
MNKLFITVNEEDLLRQEKNPLRAWMKKNQIFDFINVLNFHAEKML